MWTNAQCLNKYERQKFYHCGARIFSRSNNFFELINVDKKMNIFFLIYQKPIYLNVLGDSLQNLQHCELIFECYQHLKLSGGFLHDSPKNKLNNCINFLVRHTIGIKYQTRANFLHPIKILSSFLFFCTLPNSRETVLSFAKFTTTC